MLDRIHCTGDGSYQNFLEFSAMLNSLTLDNNNKKVTTWISTGIYPGKDKLFDSSLARIISSLGNNIKILKFSNSVLVQKFFICCIVILF